MKLITDLYEFVKAFYPIYMYRKYKYEKKFFIPGRSWPRFCGIFKSRVEAEAWARNRTSCVGYDHSSVIKVNYKTMAQTWTSDYPVIYWISKLIPPYKSIFDLGGHVGTKYRAFLKYLEFPEDFVWTVCDLPKIVEDGKRRSRNLTHLRFTSNKLKANGEPIVLMSGVLQYADFEIQEFLEKLDKKPLHLLINKLPTHKATDVYTLENLHHSITTYRITDLNNFLFKLNKLGYILVDQWTVPESRVRVPFTNLGKPIHMGFYFRSK